MHIYNYTYSSSVYGHQGLEKKHHQRKLQRVMTTTCASGVFAPAAGRKTLPAQDQHQGKLEQDETTACNYNHHKRGSILKNVVAHGFALYPMHMCEDMTSVLCVTWSLKKRHRWYFSVAFAEVVVIMCSYSLRTYSLSISLSLCNNTQLAHGHNYGACKCPCASCMLLLHPTPTCANGCWCPVPLTFSNLRWWCFSFQQLAQHSTYTCGYPLQLALVVFFLVPLVHIATCTVWWWWYVYVVVIGACGNAFCM